MTRTGRVAGRAREKLLTLGAGLAAAIPVIAATVRAIEAGWVPVADRGIIATRSYDVLTSHPPLVGQYTLAGEVTGHVTHSLGPMLFWLLALPAHYGSDVGMAVTVGALNTACVVGCVALARRRGGRVLMVATAAALALMCQSLAAETFHDVWNPSAGLFPFTLLIFLAWSLACGEHRLAPLTVLVASFVVQTHLTYLPPTLALLAIGFGGLAVGAGVGRRRRGTARRAATGEEAPSGGGGGEGKHAETTAEPSRRSRRGALAWTAATVTVAAVCWSATVDGQVSEHPGNLTLVAEAATKHKATLGAEVGWHAVVDAVGVVPWWLKTPASRWQRKHEVRATPSPTALDTTRALLAALALAGVLAVVRRRRDVAAAALIALALCLALGAVAAATPTPRVLSATLGYTMWWGSQAGMFAWLALAWSAWVGLAWAVPRAARAAVRRLARSSAGGDPGAASPGEDPGATPRRDPPRTTDIDPRATTGVDHARPAQSIFRPTPRLTALASVALTLAGVLAVAAVGAAVARQGQGDEHAVTYRPIKAIDARLADLVPRGGTVLLEGELDGATMPVKPAVRYFLVARGTRVLAPGSSLRLGDWYELHDRPFREALYLSDVPRPPVRGVPLAFATSFREGTTVNTVYVWRSPRPGR